MFLLVIHIYNTGNIYIGQQSDDEFDYNFIENYEDRKRKNMYVADIYSKFNLKKAQRMAECWEYIKIAHNTKTNVHKLAFANSCKVRLCPCCAWRRSRKYSIENSKMLRAINGKYIFLTVTVKNCAGNDLIHTINMLNNAWKRFYERKAIKQIMLGSVRNLEITYNKRTKLYHPHIHILMQVPGGYFGKHYIKQSDWQSIWREAAELDYNPIVDVRKVKNSKVYFEISKYVAKLSDVLDLKGEEAINVVETLDEALYKRRIISYTGTFRQWRREQKLKDDIEDKEESDFNNEDWEILCYRWIYGENRYNLVDIE